jgi:hypothetical protein
MSALNNAWNNAAQQTASGWNDPRSLYGNAYQQAPQQMARIPPRITCLLYTSDAADE